MGDERSCIIVVVINVFNGSLICSLYFKHDEKVKSQQALTKIINVIERRGDVYCRIGTRHYCLYEKMVLDVIAKHISYMFGEML